MPLLTTVLAAPAGAGGVSGYVLSADATSNRLTVTEAGGSGAVVLLVGPQTRIVTTDGHPLKLTDLKVGDAVGVSTQNGRALSVVVRPNLLTGGVASVNPAAMVLVVCETGSKRDVAVTLTAQTAIVSVAGAPLALGAVQAGDGVAVTYQGGAVVKVTVNAKPRHVVGTVKSVAADLKSFVVGDARGGASVTLSVTGQTVVVSNLGRPLTLQAVRPGDAASVRSNGGVASKVVVTPH